MKKANYQLRTLEYSPLIHDPDVKTMDFNFPELQGLTESLCLIKS